MTIADDDADFKKLGNHETMRKENQTCSEMGLSMSLLTTTMSKKLQWPSIVSPVPVRLLLLVSVVLLLAIVLLPNVSYLVLPLCIVAFVG